LIGFLAFLYENGPNFLKYNKKKKAGGALELGFI